MLGKETYLLALRILAILAQEGYALNAVGYL